MSIWLDKKYINLMSGQLPRFAWKSDKVANCRCIICGDSEKSRTKARGYFFPNKQTYLYKCHDCGIALPMVAFLQRHSRPLYNEYVMERFREQDNTPRQRPAVSIPPPTRTLVVHPDMHQLSAAQLPADMSGIIDYVVERKLPKSAFTKLYGTTRAHSFLAPLVGDKAERVKDGLPYLVIPLRFTNGEWYGAQFRLLTRKEYITFRWGHEQLRVFGLDALDLTQHIYIVEGPLDSLCLPNAIAMCGSDLCGGLDTLTRSAIDLTNYTLIWDNEPRNSQITSFVARAVERGMSVVIWPDGLPKDLNDMYASGYSVMSLVNKHTYQGLGAELELQRWRK